MNTQPLYRYLTMAALLGIWSCSSSRQTAQNAGEVDDLYGNSSNAAVYAGNSSNVSTVAQRPAQRYGNRQQQQFSRNTNPDYAPNEAQQGYNANSDEYYTELSTRKLNRGLSPDPGWSDDGTNAYNSGFVNGYSSAQTSAYSWNRWGFNNTGFYNGLGLGLGLGAFGGYGGYNSFGFGNPFYGGSYAYSPFGYGGGFGSPFGYGGYGGYNSFGYSPFGYGGYNSFGYGGFNNFYNPYGGFYGSPVIVNNVNVVGADPYRSNRSYGPRGSGSTNTYNNGFVNSARTGNSGGRTGTYSGDAPTYTNSRGSSSSSNGTYAAPRANSRGAYYYDNSGSTAGSGRSAGNSTPTYSSPAPSYSSGRSNSDYYAAPRQNSRGSYTPPTSSYGDNNSGRSGYNQPSYQSRQPSYQSQQQPSYSAPQRSYSQPSTPSYSAPSSGGGGGYSGGGGGGGGSRGPR
ncbi:MAG: hypothetical protein H7319_15190 [Spirosoma sp.]|nr:hypothetical protein [Spirosoma sp.]